MVLFIRSIRILLRRPYIIVFWSILALLYCLVDYYIYSLLNQFVNLGDSSSIDNIVHLLQMAFNMVVDSSTFVSTAVYFLLSVFFISIPSALILSGYLYVINNAVHGKKKTKGELISGIKMHFTRIWPVTFIVLLIIILFAIFMLVALVPTIIIINSVLNGRSELTGAAIFVGTLTTLVLFFSSVFLRINILFWFPAVIGQSKKGLKSLRKLANKKFWALTVRLLAFDIVYALFVTLSMKLSSKFALFLANWLFISLFFSLFAVYIFVIYRQMKGELRSQ